MSGAPALARSALYVPGGSEKMLARCLGAGADEVILDLEDSVPLGEKDAARTRVADFLAGVAAAGTAGGPALWVRINPGDLGERDLSVLAHAPGLAGVVAAKTESPDDVRRLDALLTAAGSGAAIVPLLESARAVLAAPAIAAGPRVRRLQLGEADLCADLGVTPGPDERELLHVRSAAVLACAAAGIHPPMGPVSTAFRDLEALRASTQALARLGYVGRACIHPAQLDVVHDVFTPTPEQVTRARAVVTALDDAARRGAAVAIDPDGRMVDEAVARHARLVLARTPEEITA